MVIQIKRLGHRVSVERKQKLGSEAKRFSQCRRPRPAQPPARHSAWPPHTAAAAARCSSRGSGPGPHGRTVSGVSVCFAVLTHKPDSPRSSQRPHCFPRQEKKSTKYKRSQLACRTQTIMQIARYVSDGCGRPPPLFMSSSAIPKVCVCVLCVCVCVAGHICFHLCMTHIPHTPRGPTAEYSQMRSQHKPPHLVPNNTGAFNRILRVPRKPFI